MLPFALYASPNDSLTMAQSFINLSLTTGNFEKIPTARLVKIITYIEKELAAIKDPGFIQANQQVLSACRAHLYLIQIKRILREENNNSRKVLLTCYRLLDSAGIYSSYLRDMADNQQSSFHEFINFSNETIGDLRSAVGTTRYRLTDLFNENIYPDFKRILHHFDRTGEVRIDSLTYFASIFHINLDLSVMKQATTATGSMYPMEMPLELISQYLQFQYLVHHKQPGIKISRLYDDWQQFYDILNLKDAAYLMQTWSVYHKRIPKDEFIRGTFTEQRCRELFEQIKAQYPRPAAGADSDGDGLTAQMIAMSGSSRERYYFPEIAPFPSCKTAKAHFQPNLARIKDVDAYMRGLLQASGYDGRYKYYYMKEGFAIGTMLEKIDRNGMPDQNERWSTTAASTRFNLYDIFSAIFFAQSSHFRIMAFTFCPQETPVMRTAATFDNITMLLQSGYSTLPQDLEERPLAEKTVTVLVYHFYQSDVGEVPLLDVTNHLSVADHLRNSRLNEVLR